MVTIKWDEIDPCATCYALVPRQVMHAHTQWHDNIAGEAIRSARRLEVLEGRETMMDMIRIQGTLTGGVNMWCDRCPWWMPDQIRSLPELIKRATEHIEAEHSAKDPAGQ